MSNIHRVIIEQREQIQEDLITYLDGMDDEIIDRVCEIVSERFHVIMTALLFEIPKKDEPCQIE